MKILNVCGHAVMVDESDFGWVSQYSWYITRKGYVARTLKGRTVTLAEILIYRFEGMQIDHIDTDKLNNQKNNLRVVTSQQNCMNRNGRRNTKSRFKGVTLNKRGKRWRARIHYNNKEVYLGSFDTEKEAAQAYNVAAKKFYKSYARTNNLQS